MLKVLLAEQYVGREVDLDGGRQYFQFLLRVVSKFNLDEGQAKALVPIGLRGPFRDLVVSMIEANCSLTTVIIPFILTRFRLYRS